MTRLCLLLKLFSKICFTFQVQVFDDVIIFEYLKSQFSQENLIISKTKRTFEVKQKTFYLVLQVLSFKFTK